MNKNIEWSRCLCCGTKIIKLVTEPVTDCFNCRVKKVVKPKRSNGPAIMITTSDRYLFLRVHKAIKRYYINDMGGTEEAWVCDVLTSVVKFNIVWRSALKVHYPSLQINGMPPPENLRKIFYFNTSTVKAGAVTY